MRLKIAKNITQQAYELIRAQILRGELDARRRLTEGYFAAQFGISKSPIREALNRLEADGLIVIVPRRGAYVRDLSVQDTEEIYELREILETWAVRNAALDATTVARLHETIDEAEACLKRGDRDKYARLDASFHRILAQSNPNSRLRKFLESMHDQMLILRHRTFALSGHNSVKQHRQIARALETGNRVAAARLMGEHIRAVRQRLLEDMRKKRETPAPLEHGAAAPPRRPGQSDVRDAPSHSAKTASSAVRSGAQAQPEPVSYSHSGRET